ncbi:hypothetical protein CHR37_06415 [Bacillus velezensis]|uniref:hypothetical protein n=1 Tax=Bacillus velezensis TaxID=492670 RepID=UPI000B943D08|nr:hypothetical protein [Bacillus velezensis]OYD12571.1 hypothetical protein CHR37_06415 [Bacillus velezensis]
MSMAKGKGVKKNLAKVVGDSLRHLYGSLQRSQHSPSLRIIYNDGNGGTLEPKETIQANQVNDIDNGNQVRENLLNQITGMLTEKINLTKVNIIKGSGKKNDDANRIVLKVAESLLKQIEGLKGDTKKEEDKKYVGDVEFADKYGEDIVETKESSDTLLAKERLGEMLDRMNDSSMRQMKQKHFNKDIVRCMHMLAQSISSLEKSESTPRTKISNK